MWTIRAKLAVIMVLALAPPMAVLSLVTTSLMRRTFERQAAATLDYVTTQNALAINRDLSNLRTLMAQHTERLQQAVAAAVAQGEVGELIAQGRYPEAGARLRSALAPSGASMITVVDRRGSTVARATGPAAYGDSVLWNRERGTGAQVTNLRPLVAAALGGIPKHGMAVLAPSALRVEKVTPGAAVPGLTAAGSRLSDQAAIPLATGAGREQRGLAMVAVVPVPDRRGTVRGAAIAARVLNRDPELARAYRRETGRWMVVCLGGVVIAGDLPAAREEVIGQALAEPFTAPILRQGKQRWTAGLASTGVNLDAAAGALRDLNGAVVGLLVVASPVTELQRVVNSMEADAARLESRSLFILLLWLGVAAVVALVSAMLAARGFIRPIRQLQDGVRRIGDGDFSYRLRVRSGDELEQLAGDFNQMAEQLARARDQERLALIGRMASGIAHDIQNTLTAIRGSVPLLAEHDLPPEQREEFAAMLVESVQRIADMARDLLEFARGEQAQLELRVMSVDDYLAGLRPQLERDFRESGVGISFRLDCPHPVRIDPGRMNRVIFNLAANARDAMGAGGVCAVSSRCERGYAEIRCSDTGPGIPAEMEGKLFRPFASHGKSYGTGLGLAICKQIVEAHGGTIEAHSETGKGATFIIRLPLAGPATETPGRS
ncbi:MAG TPA: HAMP domain-containing sensor histidine kinase [Armatimonadota bacterium]|nr:HAMP domain-containing sensor histidine kinase [Armatimonadota bacterium]